MDRYFKPGQQINGYSIVKIIGEGRYGIAYLAKNNYSKLFVIKQLKKEMLSISRKNLFYEEDTLTKLSHPSFPKFIDHFKRYGAEFYVLEYIAGTVFEDLLSYKDYLPSKAEIYTIADELLAIIALLQEKQIVHRDIRPPNVILTPSKQLVLIDFGLARYIDNRTHTPDIDYWYFGDFLIHLFYASYFIAPTSNKENPWYKELNITPPEKHFLKKLMGIEPSYYSISQIKNDLDKLKTLNSF